MDDARTQRVLDRARAIPVGFVRTYGDLSPGAPRFAGVVLFACDDPDVPWHRVVRADGTAAEPVRVRQLELLAGEGVPLRGSRVDLSAVGWPDEEW
jgi:alkylated DNA nucleotide flippase Atl1